ncbi:MAG TPA: FeoB-associated Cys-rich membrane protein [Pyrinomonadaceae bacterium]|nr:FeoB-associated Cys-rich membrane protein [Pyrinomonadaceae bacterium]
MNFQNIVVGIVILGAIIYVGLMFWKKAKSFKPTNSVCADDCGCENKKKSKI